MATLTTALFFPNLNAFARAVDLSLLYFAPWLYAPALLALLLAAHLRLENHGRAWILAMATHALILGLLALTFGLAPSPTITAFYVSGGALLVLAVSSAFLARDRDGPARRPLAGRAG